MNNLVAKTIENGYLLPWNPKNEGGVVNENLEFVKESSYNGDWWKLGGYYEFDQQSVKKIRGKVIFLGFFIKHWGHYLMDCLGRAWYLTEHSFNDCYIAFLPVKDAVIDGNYMRLLELLGVKHEFLLCNNSVIQADEIVIPDCIMDLNNHCLKVWVNVFNYISEQAHITVMPKAVYLSRECFSDAKKKEIGEIDVQKQFLANGYSCLYPEKLTLDEQISIFRTSKHIACVNGTIPMNILFKLNNDCNLIVINKTSRYHGNLELTCTASNTKPRYINAFYEPYKKVFHLPRYLGEGPFWMKISSEFEDFFVGNGYSLSIEKKSVSEKVQHWVWYTWMCVKIKFRDLLKKVKSAGFLKRGKKH